MAATADAPIPRPATAAPLDRTQFPVGDEYVFLNHAGVAPLPRVAVDAMAADSNDAMLRGSLSGDDRAETLEAARTSAAQLLGVPAADIAIVKNTTEGLAFVANGLTWVEGDRVLVPDLEFPSTIFPWLGLAQRHGVQVDRIQPVGARGELPLEAFEAALIAGAARTKVVALSWVQFQTGWRTDLAALAQLCHAHGALLCADAIQGLGAIPADLAAWGVDFAMADAHKWMLGPEGVGVLYVAQAVRELVYPSEPGWASIANRMDWDDLNLVYDDSARRYEGGTYNLVGGAGMGASLDLIATAGVDAIWSYLAELGDYLAAGLADAGATVISDRSADHRSGIVTFTLPGVSSTDAAEQLMARQIVGSPRAGGVRLSPHAWNTVDDIDAVLAAVRSLAR